MRQLDLFAAFAAVEAAAAKPVPVAAKRVTHGMSPQEFRRLWEVESRYFSPNGCIYRQVCEQVKRELKNIAAGRLIVSKRYLKMLRSY